MANYNTNDQALLTYLEELKSKTQSVVDNETHNLHFWTTGEYKNHQNSFFNVNDEQVEFYIKNAMERLEPLQHRLEWLDIQIQNIHFSAKFEQIKNS